MKVVVLFLISILGFGCNNPQVEWHCDESLDYAVVEAENGKFFVSGTAGYVVPFQECRDNNFPTRLPRYSFGKEVYSLKEAERFAEAERERFLKNHSHDPFRNPMPTPTP